ncbi:MAG: RagB/SusD family nutrient uptake outer membrane protein [Muribaculaceae bacterium]|nr:RagB/SusD family nutrient uptake outer membrane protein [Muribaculaceae bacterium]
MKTINKFLLSVGIAASAFGLTSCVGDLDLAPRDPSEITNVSDDMDRVFADLYLQFATYGANGNSPVSGFDGGMAAFQRAMFIAEEIPTDEASWLWDPADYGPAFNAGNFNANQGALYGVYSRLMINITLCNQFIQCVDNGTFKLETAEDQAKAQEYKRQALTLWGACYYYMLSFYDKVPYADADTPVGAIPTQLPRAKVYELVTSKLEEVVAEYAENQCSYRGFVGLDAAESILAKIYLNGEVFAGRADYENCYKHCKNVIARLGKGGYYGNGLARSYNALFGANNSGYVLNPGNEVNEIIWSIAADNVSLTGYSGSTFLCVAWLGTNGVEATMGEPTNIESENGKITENADGIKTYKIYSESYLDPDKFADAMQAYNDVKNNKTDSWKTQISETVNGTHYSFDPTQIGYIASDWYNVSDGWKCMVARKSFVRKFDWNDVEMTQSDDTRVSLWQTAKHGFSVENTSLIGDDWGKNGYITPKYSNWAYNEDGTINKDASPKTNRSFANADYAVIRLAEIYLTAAEAILNGGGGSQAEALQYVNYIRARAYGDAPGDTSHAWTSLSMQDLRDERCRELYQENVRRTDLIRWNQWCTGYTWEWKGGIQNGTNLPERTKLYPIPTRVMSASSMLEQTTGY